MLMVLSENLYIILNPWRFQQDAESWMVLKRPTNFYFRRSLFHVRLVYDATILILELTDEQPTSYKMVDKE